MTVKINKIQDWYKIDIYGAIAMYPDKQKLIEDIPNIIKLMRKLT